MTVKELKDKLSKYDEKLEVTTSNNMGLFSAIDKVTLQEWGDDAFASVTLVLGEYVNKKCIVNQYKLNESRIDNEFIDNVNENLESGENIDKKEALKLKSPFIDDFNELHEKIQNNIMKDYEDIMSESMIELFGNTKPLENRTLGELQELVKLEWMREITSENFHDRYDLLRFLYYKLNQVIKSKMLEKAKETITNNLH